MRRWSISKMFLDLLCNYENDQSDQTFKTCFETNNKDSNFQRLCVCVCVCVFIEKYSIQKKI